MILLGDRLGESRDGYVDLVMRVLRVINGSLKGIVKMFFFFPVVVIIDCCC